MTPRRRLAIAGAFVLLLLAALAIPVAVVLAGDDGSADACGLVDRTTVEAALGGPPSLEPETERAPDGGPPAATCLYERYAPGTLNVVGVTVVEEPLGEARFRELAGTTFAGRPSESLSGLGDLAFWEADAEEPGIGLVSALRGSRVLVVQVKLENAAEEELRRTAIAIAREALGRLGA